MADNESKDVKTPSEAAPQSGEKSASPVQATGVTAPQVTAPSATPASPGTAVPAAAYDGNAQVIMIQPLSNTLQKLRTYLTTNSELTLSDAASTQNAVQIALMHKPCLVMTAIQNQSDIAKILAMVQVLKQDVKRGVIKVVITSSIKQSQIISKFESLGVQEFIIEPIPDKQLQFKINLHVKANKAARKKQQEIEMKKIAAADKKADGSELEVKNLALKSAEKKGGELKDGGVQASGDVFVFKQNKPAKKGSKWAFRMEGPDPKEGTWQKMPDSVDGESQWRYMPKNPEDAKDGNVQYTGDEPTPDGKGGWDFTGKKPELTFAAKDGSKLGTQASIDEDGNFVAAKDSEAALKKADDREKERKDVEAKEKAEKEAKLQAAKQALSIKKEAMKEAVKPAAPENKEEPKKEETKPKAEEVKKKEEPFVDLKEDKKDPLKKSKTDDDDDDDGKVAEEDSESLDGKDKNFLKKKKEPGEKKTDDDDDDGDIKEESTPEAINLKKKKEEKKETSNLDIDELINKQKKSKEDEEKKELEKEKKEPEKKAKKTDDEDLDEDKEDLEAGADLGLIKKKKKEPEKKETKNLDDFLKDQKSKKEEKPEKEKEEEKKADFNNKLKKEEEKKPGIGNKLKDDDKEDEKEEDDLQGMALTDTDGVKSKDKKMKGEDGKGRPIGRKDDGEDGGGSSDEDDEGDSEDGIDRNFLKKKRDDDDDDVATSEELAESHGQITDTSRSEEGRKMNARDSAVTEEADGEDFLNIERANSNLFKAKNGREPIIVPFRKLGSPDGAWEPSGIDDKGKDSSKVYVFVTPEMKGRTISDITKLSEYWISGEKPIRSGKHRAWVFYEKEPDCIKGFDKLPLETQKYLLLMQKNPDESLLEKIDEKIEEKEELKSKKEKEEDEKKRQEDDDKEDEKESKSKFDDDDDDGDEKKSKYDEDKEEDKKKSKSLDTETKKDDDDDDDDDRSKDLEDESEKKSSTDVDTKQKRKDDDDEDDVPVITEESDSKKDAPQDDALKKEKMIEGILGGPDDDDSNNLEKALGGSSNVDSKKEEDAVPHARMKEIIFMLMMSEQVLNPEVTVEKGIEYFTGLLADAYPGAGVSVFSVNEERKATLLCRKNPAAPTDGKVIYLKPLQQKDQYTCEEMPALQEAITTRNVVTKPAGSDSVFMAIALFEQSYTCIGFILIEGAKKVSGKEADDARYFTIVSSTIKGFLKTTLKKAA